MDLGLDEEQVSAMESESGKAETAPAEGTHAAYSSSSSSSSSGTTTELAEAVQKEVRESLSWS